MLNPNDRIRLTESENSNTSTDTTFEDPSIFDESSLESRQLATAGGIEPIKGEEFMQAFSTHAE